MTLLIFFAAFLATVISTVELTKIAVKHHDRSAPVSLSELAAAEDRLLTRFRKILFVCATLFAVTVYWFIVPRLQDSLPTIVVWTIIYLGILLAAVVPARDKTFRLHFIAAQLFGLAMLILAYIFWTSLHGTFALLELIIIVVMTASATLTYIDKRRFIVYELAFLYLNHLSIVIAALALRR